jgi:CRP/FNR family transcriptional regulator, dissimilatory nitrate respiration regulator
MTLNQKVALLRRSPLGQDLPAAQIRKIAAVAEKRDFEPGAEVFSEGDPAQGLYVLVTGRVKIFKLSAQGREQILNVLGPGQTLGEAVVFAGTAFPAHAEALQPVQTLYLPRPKFVALLSREPRIALGLLSVMARRLQYFARMVDELSLQDVPARLARYLVERRIEGRQDTITLGLKKVELAQRLGTVPETLSRALSKLTQRGLIRVKGARIEVLDPKGLEALVADGRIGPER